MEEDHEKKTTQMDEVHIEIAEKHLNHDTANLTNFFEKISETKLRKNENILTKSEKVENNQNSFPFKLVAEGHKSMGVGNFGNKANSSSAQKRRIRMKKILPQNYNYKPINSFFKPAIKNKSESLEVGETETTEGGAGTKLSSNF